MKNFEQYPIVFFIALNLLLASCGGGSSSDSPTTSDTFNPSTVTITPTTTLDTALLSKQNVAMTEQNAKEKILEGVIFRLEFFHDIVANVISYVLVSSISNGMSLETLSSYGCQFALKDNDYNNIISTGDVVSVNHKNCQANQYLIGFIDGFTEINIDNVVDDGNQLLIEARADLDGISFTSDSDGLVTRLTGSVIYRTENPSGKHPTGMLSEISIPAGGAVQFLTSQGETFILVEPLFRAHTSGSKTTLTLGAKGVADSVIDATYGCPYSAIEYLWGFPTNGTLIKCEGSEDSFVSAGVHLPEDSMASLIINNNNPVFVDWEDIVSLSLRTRLGIQ
jgi:hypothetical protein